MTMIAVPTLDGSDAFQAYCAEPAGTAKAAIIVIQEIFGVNQGIRQKCDHWAALGYLALAPDLFWRIQPGVELDPDIPDQFQQALGLMGKFDQRHGVIDIEATIRAGACVAGRHGQGRRGRLLPRRASRLHDRHAHRRRCERRLLWRRHRRAARREARDRAAGAAACAAGGSFCRSRRPGADARGARRPPRVTIYDYAGEDHGFATETGKRRSEAAAQLADSRTTAFFAEHLA